jgi:hypothetical protein
VAATGIGCGVGGESLTPEGVRYRGARLAAWELGSGARCLVDISCPYGAASGA